MNAPIRFHRLMGSAVLPMRADKSALGGIPAAAHQYCEALRTASGFGWYAFAPKNLELRWDGAQTLVKIGSEWSVLSSVVDAEFAQRWKESAPEAVRDMVPPFLSQLFVPGVIQVWTGLLVETAPDWSVLIRPLANVTPSRSHACYEGIVETDWFRPVPLFINIRLLATDHVITIPRMQPLFQVQPVRREAYTTALDGAEVRSVPDGDALSEAQWAGLASTLRSVSPERPHDIGRYGAEVRRRGRSPVSG